MSTPHWTPPSGRHKALYIGDLVKATGRSVHTIRWYEKQGLIPGVDRDRGGRRTYVADHIGWLEFIEQLRRTGMSVKEMRAYADLVMQGKASLKDRISVLEAHREKVLQDLAEVRAALDLVEQKITYYDDWLTTGKRPAEIPRLMRKPDSETESELD